MEEWQRVNTRWKLYVVAPIIIMKINFVFSCCWKEKTPKRGEENRGKAKVLKKSILHFATESSDIVFLHVLIFPTITTTQCPPLRLVSKVAIWTCQQNYLQPTKTTAKELWTSHELVNAAIPWRDENMENRGHSNGKRKAVKTKNRKNV